MKTKIPIKRYVMDEAASWEQRYLLLEEHHNEETRFLIKRIAELETSTTCAHCGATIACTPCLRVENRSLRGKVEALQDHVEILTKK